MSYFEELRRESETLTVWADLRHEQGAEVSPQIYGLVERIRALIDQFKQMPDSSTLADREPNDLEAIRAARPSGPRKLINEFPSDYAERVKGAFAARAAGCTLGAIVENWPVKDMQDFADACGVDFPPVDYWPVAPAPMRIRYLKDRGEAYTRSKLAYVPVDDDVTYTLLGLLVLERSGPNFTTADIAEAWLKYLPMACTAEEVTLANLKAGIPPNQAGATNNPYVEWIGADIRCDPWGYAAPGDTQKAAELAYRDAFLSHRRNGVYGAMYFAAVIAAAFTVDDPLDACRIALSEIPATCRLAGDIAWALDRCNSLENYLHARRLVDERFGGMCSVHTNNNACLTIFGLAIGGRNVTKVIGNTVAMGLDNDCTAATAGSIVGAVVGAANVPEHWHKPFNNKVRTYMNDAEWFEIDDVVKRFEAQARTLWQ